MQFLQTAIHHANSHASRMQPCIPQIVRILQTVMDPTDIYASHWYICVPQTTRRPTDTHESHRKPCIPQTVMRPIDSYASQKWQPCIPQTAMHLTDALHPTASHATHRQLCVPHKALHLRDSYASHRQPMNPTDNQTSQKTESQDPANSDGSRIKLRNFMIALILSTAMDPADSHGSCRHDGSSIKLFIQLTVMVSLDSNESSRLSWPCRQYPAWKKNYVY